MKKVWQVVIEIEDSGLTDCINGHTNLTPQEVFELLRFDVPDYICVQVKDFKEK